MLWLSIARLQCGHGVCRGCLVYMFQLSIKDTSTMPPRCCSEKAIPPRHVAGFAPVSLMHEWAVKVDELKATGPLYCPLENCGQWIKVRRGILPRKRVDCRTCGTRVCLACRRRWHGGGACPDPGEDDEVLGMAKDQGWSRCYRCGHVVEKTGGCFHITWYVGRGCEGPPPRVVDMRCSD